MDTKVFRDISYGMYVVTTKSNIPVGCFINTLIQITSENPTIAISINKENYTNKILKEQKKFAVSVLKENSTDKIISTFGYFSSIEKNKFENVEYKEIDNIPVVVEDMCSYLICEVINIVETSTHDIFIGKVLDTKKLSDDTPMTYKYYHEVLKGKSPKKAPTYIEEKENEEKIESNKYQCTICGYIYDDSIENVKFEELPEDWKCPRCGVGKEYFKKVN